MVRAATPVQSEECAGSWSELNSELAIKRERGLPRARIIRPRQHLRIGARNVERVRLEKKV